MIKQYDQTVSDFKAAQADLNFAVACFFRFLLSWYVFKLVPILWHYWYKKIPTLTKLEL